MRREDISCTVSLLLLFSVAVTGITGYIQSQLELRKLRIWDRHPFKLNFRL